jgi:hypothetical protein
MEFTDQFFIVRVRVLWYPLDRVCLPGWLAKLVCPANCVPVAMIGTGSKGAVYGTREEAWSRTGGEPVAAD